MKKKVMFISSCGGHLTELLQLKGMFNDYDYSIITENTKDNRGLKDKYSNKIHFLIYGTKDHPFTYLFKLVANCFISLYWYIKIRPQYIITTGAHTAGPMCCLGKIFGCKVVFIETFANSSKKTITGSILYHLADMFIVQHESMLKLYPKAIYGGWIF